MWPLSPSTMTDCKISGKAFEKWDSSNMSLLIDKTTQLKPTQKSLEQVLLSAPRYLGASTMTERALPSF